jgi:phosphoribosylformylglycinamidine synthase
VRVGVVSFPGSCDDRDALAAAARVGEAVSLGHADTTVGHVDAVIIPGGFSHGDYLRPGAIARFSAVMDAIAEFARAGGPVLGICNGFQVLCEAGLLPGALMAGPGLRFLCRQVEVEVRSARTPFTADRAGRRLSMPVKHAAGRYYAPEAVLDELEAHAQIVLAYAPGQNPNGSLGDIAGVCNRAGNVLGLMPHPEHAVDPLLGPTDGLTLFQALREHVDRCLAIA